MKIAVGADHAGFELKARVIDFLSLNQYEAVDCGPSSSTESVDYPDYAQIVAEKVVSKDCQFGILICGTGIGMCISANKIPGIRAALVFDENTARLSREHNDSNVLCLGSRTLPMSKSLDLIKIWLTTEFASGRHTARLKKITQLENAIKNDSKFS